MKALLIDGFAQSIESIELTKAELPHVIGFDTVIADDIGDGHVVFFDEDCFIRGAQGRFQIDALAPIAGRAVILASAVDGAAAACELGIDDMLQRLSFK